MHFRIFIAVITSCCVLLGCSGSSNDRLFDDTVQPAFDPDFEWIPIGEEPDLSSRAYLNPDQRFATYNFSNNTSLTVHINPQQNYINRLEFYNPKQPPISFSLDENRKLTELLVGADLYQFTWSGEELKTFDYDGSDFNIRLYPFPLLDEIEGKSSAIPKIDTESHLKNSKRIREALDLTDFSVQPSKTKEVNITLGDCGLNVEGEASLTVSLQNTQVPVVYEPRFSGGMAVVEVPVYDINQINISRDAWIAQCRVKKQNAGLCFLASSGALTAGAAAGSAIVARIAANQGIAITAENAGAAVVEYLATWGVSTSAKEFVVLVNALRAIQAYKRVDGATKRLLETANKACDLDFFWGSCEDRFDESQIDGFPKQFLRDDRSIVLSIEGNIKNPASGSGKLIGYNGVIETAQVFHDAQLSSEGGLLPSINSLEVFDDRVEFDTTCISPPREVILTVNDTFFPEGCGESATQRDTVTFGPESYTQEFSINGITEYGWQIPQPKHNGKWTRLATLELDEEETEIDEEVFTNNYDESSVCGTLDQGSSSNADGSGGGNSSGNSNSGGVLYGFGGGSMHGGSSEQTLNPSVQPTVSFGEPHIVTLDGLQFDYQAVGEFVLAKSTLDNSEFEIQVRQSGEPTRSVSRNTAVAVNVGGDNIHINRLTNELFLNGNVTNLTEEIQLPGEGRLIPTFYGFTILWPDESEVNIEFVRDTDFINIHMRPADRHAGKIVGLLGNFDGIAENDIVDRGGNVYQTSLSEPLQYNTLYRAFGDSWRVTDRTSIFYRRPGETTAAFTDYTYPDKYFTIDSLTTEQISYADGLCCSSLKDREFYYDSCLMDVTLLGESACPTFSGGLLGESSSGFQPNLISASDELVPMLVSPIPGSVVKALTDAEVNRLEPDVKIQISANKQSFSHYKIHVGTYDDRKLIASTDVYSVYEFGQGRFGPLQNNNARAVSDMSTEHFELWVRSWPIVDMDVLVTFEYGEWNVEDQWVTRNEIQFPLESESIESFHPRLVNPDEITSLISPGSLTVEWDFNGYHVPFNELRAYYGCDQGQCKELPVCYPGDNYVRRFRVIPIIPPGMEIVLGVEYKLSSDQPLNSWFWSELETLKSENSWSPELDIEEIIFGDTATIALPPPLDPEGATVRWQYSVTASRSIGETLNPESVIDFGLVDIHTALPNSNIVLKNLPQDNSTLFLNVSPTLINACYDYDAEVWDWESRFTYPLQQYEFQSR